ncbi:MAG: thioredoxin family protein [Bacillota bacterium]
MREAARDTGVQVNVVKVEDMFDILARGCSRTPGLVVGGRMRLQGRLATVQEIRSWLQED